ALGNSGDHAAVPALMHALREHDAPLVRGHAAWALGHLGGKTARAALEHCRMVESDADVRAEIIAALGEPNPRPLPARKGRGIVETSRRN
ncbi:MAG: HEAT repeat domain-containing protein, partial [Chloroflexota bacterium]|nr:HEAT repeat domain-containing protein [Chloroflexota bacterium]